MSGLRHWFRERRVVHPADAKEATYRLPVETIPLPAWFRVSLGQQMGAASKPMVRPGDRVLRGQPIGEPSARISAWAHAPTSGVVRSLANRNTANGRMATVVEIESDGEDRPFAPLETVDWSTLSPQETRTRIERAGVVGMGGAAFPTHVKLNPPANRPIHTLILNGAECEPCLTADDRLMVESADRIWLGAQILVRLLGVSRVRIGIEDNKPLAIDAMRRALDESVGDVRIVALPTAYPQGGERQLVRAIAGCEVPTGGLPQDVGCLVENVATAVAVADAVIAGAPLIERVLTVTGCVRQPRNLRVRVGTLVRDLLDACGGVTGSVGKVICGGPMMGVALSSPEIGIHKVSSGLVVLGGGPASSFQSIPCISCGRCVQVCPAGLLPCTLSEWMESNRPERAEFLHAMDCIECGACAFVCPAHRPLVHLLRLGKQAIAARRREEEARKKGNAR